MQLKNLWFFFFGFIYILGAIVFQIDALFTPDGFSLPKAILALPFSQDVNSSNEDKRIVPVKEKKILKKRIKKTASHPAPPLRCVFMKMLILAVIFFFHKGARPGHTYEKTFSPTYIIYIYIYNDPIYIIYIWGGGKKNHEEGPSGPSSRSVIFCFFINHELRSFCVGGPDGPRTKLIYIFNYEDW